MTGLYVVVTGAAGALGAAVAETLHAAGYKVVGIDRAEIPDSGPFSLALSGVDLTDEENVAEAFAAIAAHAKRIHGLVNVAGGFRWETVQDGAPASWDFLYRINIVTALLASRAALNLMGEAGGAIVNISAAGSVKAAAGMGAYAASKSGVSRLTEALAEELKDSNIRVNAVMPSIIDTSVNRADMPDAEHDRWVTPAALADVVAFLLSDGARAVTGALVPVVGKV